MIDLYKDNHVRASVCKLFSLKNFSETWTGFLPNFTRMLLFTDTEKSGLWSDTGAQAPLIIPKFQVSYLCTIS